MHHYVSMNLDERPVTMEIKGETGAFRRVVLRRGAAWIAPANEIVSLRINSDFRYVRMSIDPLYFHRLTAEPGAPLLELRRTYGVAKSQIGLILSALIAESDAGNPSGLPSPSTHRCTRQADRPHAGAKKPQLAAARWIVDRRSAAPLELLDTHLESNIPLRLATEVGLSPAHFARAFKETMGPAPSLSAASPSERASVARRRERGSVDIAQRPASPIRRTLPGSSARVRRDAGKCVRSRRRCLPVRE
jgi:AraC-like DNA-binding protein